MVTRSVNPARLPVSFSLDDGLARDRIGEAEAPAQVLEHAPHAVEIRDHRRPGIDDALHAIPLADDAVRALAGLHQGEAAHAREIALHVAVLRQECLLLAGLDAKADDVECGHGASCVARVATPYRTPAASSSQS